jgi:hypothetical protein
LRSFILEPLKANIEYRIPISNRGSEDNPSTFDILYSLLDIPHFVSNVGFQPQPAQFVKLTSMPIQRGFETRTPEPVSKGLIVRRLMVITIQAMFIRACEAPERGGYFSRSCGIGFSGSIRERAFDDGSLPSAEGSHPFLSISSASRVPAGRQGLGCRGSL